MRCGFGTKGAKKDMFLPLRLIKYIPPPVQLEVSLPDDLSSDDFASKMVGAPGRRKAVEHLGRKMLCAKPRRIDLNQNHVCVTVYPGFAEGDFLFLAADF